MDRRKKIQQIVFLICIMILTFFLSSVLFYLCNRFDNKYTKKGPQPIGGVLKVDEIVLKENGGYIYPILNWEIYRGKLLSPDDFINSNPLPDENVFIGQYGGFEGKLYNGTNNHHGSSTYRLTIFIPSETKNYTLELPEIYSSYKLYINNLLVKQLGEPDPQNYYPQTDMSYVTVQASNKIEILIAVSDYTHIYSGMVYPAAFGNTESVSYLLNSRLIFRTISCVLSVIFGLIYFIIGFLGIKKRHDETRQSLPFIYSALCISYSTYICYPIVKTMFLTDMNFYALENLSYCLMLLLVIIIQNKLCHINGWWTSIFVSLGAVSCCWSIFVPVFLSDHLNMVILYSKLIELYTCSCALYITMTAIYSVYKVDYSIHLMLVGICVFDASLIESIPHLNL